MTKNEVITMDDGFDDVAMDQSPRLIQGQIVKFVNIWNLDGRPWDSNTLLLNVGVKVAAQLWKDQKPIETRIITPTNPVNVDALNAALPIEEWEDGLDGLPRTPWQIQYVVYLINPADAAMYTALNSTTGFRIAFDQLCEKVKYMRALSGAPVVPIVRLSSAPMKTKFGTKPRPHFHVVEWRQFGSQTPVQPALLGKPVTVDPAIVRARQSAAAEKIDDCIPY